MTNNVKRFFFEVENEYLPKKNRQCVVSHQIFVSKDKT